MKKYFLYVIIISFFCASGVLHAYQLMGIKWKSSDFPVSYYMNSANCPINAANAAAAINAGFALWASMSTNLVNFTYMGATSNSPYYAADGYNVIGWYNLNAVSPGTLGVTFAWYIPGYTDIVEADIAISAGGSSCWESAFMGIPLLVVITADNQEGIAAFLEKKGAAINLGWPDSLSSKKFTNAFQKLVLDYKVRKEMSDCGQQLIDGLGADRIVRAIIEKGNEKK